MLSPFSALFNGGLGEVMNDVRFDARRIQISSSQATNRSPRDTYIVGHIELVQRIIQIDEFLDLLHFSRRQYTGLRLHFGCGWSID